MLERVEVIDEHVRFQENVLVHLHIIVVTLDVLIVHIDER